MNAMPANVVHTRSVPENKPLVGLIGGASEATRPLREYRRANPQLEVGQMFNPFQLFYGAIVPTAILRCPQLLPSEKLVFARLTQFAGAKGKAWPSLERLAVEVAICRADEEMRESFGRQGPDPPLEPNGSFERVRVSVASALRGEPGTARHPKFGGTPIAGEWGTPLRDECPTPRTDECPRPLIHEWGGNHA